MATSFADQFAKGSAIMGDLIDTYGEAKRKSRVQEVMDSTPSEGRGYTSGDGQQLAQIAEAKDAQGNSYYQLDARPDGTFGLKMRGEGGDYVDVPNATFSPGKYTEFLGQRHTGGLTPEQIDSKRYAALADIMTRDDPVRGLQMRQHLRQEERTQEKHGWERDTTAKQLKALERAEGVQQVMDSAMQISDEKLPDAASGIGGLLKQFGVPVMYKGATKGGYQYVSVDPASGKEGPTFELSPLQLRQAAASSLMALRGYGAESLSLLQSAHDGLAKTVGAWNDTLYKTAHSQIAALEGERKAAHDDAFIAQGWARINAAASSAAAQRLGATRFERGNDGNLYAVYAVDDKKNGPRRFVQERVQGDGVPDGVFGDPPTPIKVPEKADGVYAVPDGNGGRVPMKPDGLGGFIATNGVFPDERNKFLSNAGVPPEAMPSMRFNKTGNAILVGNKAYNATTPDGKVDRASLREALQEIKSKLRTQQLLEEAQLQERRYIEQQRLDRQRAKSPEPQADWNDYGLPGM